MRRPERAAISGASCSANVRRGQARSGQRKRRTWAKDRELKAGDTGAYRPEEPSGIAGLRPVERGFGALEKEVAEMFHRTGAG